MPTRVLFFLKKKKVISNDNNKKRNKQKNYQNMSTHETRGPGHLIKNNNFFLKKFVVQSLTNQILNDKIKKKI